MNNLNYKKQENRSYNYSDIENHGSALEELWIGIHFPEISLEAHGILQGDACVVLKKEKGNTRVHRANPSALAQGIETGMSLNSAYALCHRLHTTLHDGAKERVLLQAHARTAMRFTPRISLVGSDTLLLEVRASLRLFGQMKNLYRQLKAAFCVTHTIACAPLAEAAELMARHGIEKLVRSPDRLQSALGGISLSQTPLEKRLKQQLARCGLYSLRDLWRLPRPNLARRFGPNLLHYLDQLSGRRRVPQKPYEAESDFKSGYDFVQETEDRQYLLHAVTHLLQQAQTFLQLRASMSEKIGFRLIYTQRHGTAQKGLTLNVHAQQGGDRVEHFLPQLNEQLERLELEEALVRVELHLDQFRPRTDSTGDLFKKHRGNTDSWPMLLDLLFARLGPEHVYRLSLVADHRPEKAWAKAPIPHTISGTAVLPGPGKRPAWLFKRPVECLGQRFSLFSDAERLESGWWDGQDLRREYYRAVAPSGRHCWLFRDLQAANEQWYMHGLFA